MNDQRYQELLGMLLDDELTEPHAVELVEWLRINPAAREDAQRTLLLWEAYSQGRSPERSAFAFMEACKTRIAADTDQRAFVDGVKGRLHRAGKLAKDATGHATYSVTEQILRLLHQFRWSLSGGAALLLAAFVVWLFPTTHNEPILSIPAGTKVALERAGQPRPSQDGLVLQPGDFLRVHGTNGAALIYGEENTRVTLNNQAELKILPWTKGKRLELVQGKIQATAARQKLWSPMVLITAQAQARMIGTQFSLSASTNATRLDVTEGRVLFTRTRDEAAIKVGAGAYAVATTDYELAALPFTGGVRREWWSGVDGQTAYDLRSDPRYPGQPDGFESASVFELNPLQTNRLGIRFCGYIHPPVTGDYEFWLAGGPEAALYMSPSENPAERVPIAQNLDRSRSLDQPRFKGSSPWAPPVLLVAGRRYYVEALVLITEGEGHLSVAWKPPGRPREPLAREYLSPLKPE